MQELTPDECKKLLLKILINVATFCEEHKIEYSIAYGTLIGAIRHKGFIPWDDDIDIIMMRDEYERFVSTYKDDYYQLISGENMANHYHVVVADNSTQLVFKENTENHFFYKGGIWVDIFPIDKVPNNECSYQFLRKKIRLLAALERIGQFVKNKKYIIPHYILRPFSKKIGNSVVKLIRSTKNYQTKAVANLSLFYLNYPLFPSYFMDEFTEVEFEGKHFKAMVHYDEFLKGIYGDYLKLPPVSERTPRHSYKVYKKKN